MDTHDSFSTVLASLARPLAKEADTLLDLREAVLGNRRAGRCVNCYFKLLGARARSGDPPALTPLRQWLEANIEIVARDAEEREIERTPLRIDEAESIEEFADRIFQFYRHDRVEIPELVQLDFAYRGSAPAAI
jgi:hypothetical protein